MSADFHLLGKAVEDQFTTMSSGELFVVDIDGDRLYEAYQSFFPAGTNDVFRKQREHECSTCRNFIRNLGNVVSINEDLTIETLWDVGTLPEPYNTVARRMNEMIKVIPINGIYRGEEAKYGGKPNRDTENANIVWNHFHAKLDKKHHAPKGSTKSAAALIGEYANSAQVFGRGMKEITQSAIDTIGDLMATKGALYRGEEFAAGFNNFKQLYTRYAGLQTEQQRNAFIWQYTTSAGARLRNTAFGTLMIDLSEGMDIESAVKRWEGVMAPSNYKRPTALITPRMVEDAMKTINDLGIEPSLHRRLANVSDLAVNNVLYVDNDVRGKMRGGVASLLAEAAVASQPSNVTRNIIDIGIDGFMADILPTARSMEVMVTNSHQANFMTLTAPVYGDSPHLFKWDNAFAWSYDGNITDSIKERVKAAGGQVQAKMRVSLAWFNPDDLDLHVYEPGNGTHIHFANKKSRVTGGELDVDMNAWGKKSDTEPVENVHWQNVIDGDYKVVVNNYNKRTSDRPGFVIEIESDGQTMHYSSKVSPASGRNINALTFTVKGGKIVEVKTIQGIEGRAFSQEKWGVKTEQFTRVDTLLLSPNHWDGQAVGNKHYFFILDGCKTDVPARGIYNEFLKPEMEKHRKVFEVLGNKMMCDPVPDQLSGVGFSSTRGDKVMIKVDHRIYNVQF